MNKGSPGKTGSSQEGKSFIIILNKGKTIRLLITEI
jgi:hypothetical protein